jgi:GDPmannose 4,6-dehydratase
MTKTALITGITGQDGSYLAELLLRKGYTVHGMIRRSSSIARNRIDHLENQSQLNSDQESRLFLHYGDMTDSGALNRLIKSVCPAEVYNLAAQSHVHVSFQQPEYTGEVNAIGVTRLLEAIRTSGCPTRFYQASTSEMFGTSPAPQNEQTCFRPSNPYGWAKLYAHWATVGYREGHNMFACSGILFNHESPRRGENFITRRATRGVAAILAGRRRTLEVGSLASRRDWGHARDYVQAMWSMLQQETADDYVIATGTSRTVQQLVETAFGMVGLDWRAYVVQNQAYCRPSDPADLRGDASKARRQLAWAPTVSFTVMLREMLIADIRAEGLRPEQWLKE